MLIWVIIWWVRENNILALISLNISFLSKYISFNLRHWNDKPKHLFNIFYMNREILNPSSPNKLIRVDYAIEL